MVGKRGQGVLQSVDSGERKLRCAVEDAARKIDLPLDGVVGLGVEWPIDFPFGLVVRR